MDMTTERIARTIAAEIGARPAQVSAAAELLDGGATVPFVARYRKEATGGLDDTQLRTLSDRLAYLRDLEARRQAILQSIGEQGKLTDDLARAIAGADTKARLEDLYLPFRPKRRTKAMIARERGLEPLLRAIEATRSAKPEALAQAYLGEDVPDEGRARRPARHPGGRAERERRPSRPPARVHARRGDRLGQPRAREGGGGRKVLGLFRPPRKMGEHPLAPSAGDHARRQRGRGHHLDRA